MAATIASRSARGTSSRRPAREAKLAAREALRAPKLAELARLDDAAFRALFAKSPVKRTGRDRFVRNVLIAIGNSGDAVARAAKPSGCSTTPRRWCAARPYGRSAGSIPTRLAALAPVRAAENDPCVAEEWAAAAEA